MAWHLICSLNNNNGEIIVRNPIVVVHFHPMRKILHYFTQKKTLVETRIGQLFEFSKRKNHWLEVFGKKLKIKGPLIPFISKTSKNY